MIIHKTNIDGLDLNLLRLFDAIYRLRSVSRAAEALDLSQPAVSQGLMRLRLAVGDPLFVRAPGGMRPTARAERLSNAVRSAIALIEQALNEGAHFDPKQASMTLRLHLSDIGEARMLPKLMCALNEEAPGVRLESFPLPHDDIVKGLDAGTINFAIGFFPSVRGTRSLNLLHDRYAILLRAGHPLIATKNGRIGLRDLQRLEYVAVRSHAETLRILQELELDDRLKLTSAHFLALPAIVKQTDLAVVMPYKIALGFAEVGNYVVLEAPLPKNDFTVSLHWSKRFERDPAHSWTRNFLIRLFTEN